MYTLNFTPASVSEEIPAFRKKVRHFLQSIIDQYSPLQRAHSWTGCDPAFSEALGQQGWIGMQWPQQYGGGEKSAAQRYVVIEELLAAGAPVGYHWIADRQSGTLLLRYATEAIKHKYLPRIASGELCFCIGMSEPNSGSDLASLKTRAKKVAGGWRLNGSKLWTTNVDMAQVMIALVRTADPGDQRHSGLSQFLIELSSEGVTVNPITDQTGESHFGEVFFDDVFVADHCLIGTEGNGWQQVNEELSLERSGPERYLSSYRLLEDYLDALKPDPAQEVTQLIGQQVCELWTLRQMSMAVASRISKGQDADLEATIVKDLGASFEQNLPQRIQAITNTETKIEHRSNLQAVLNYLLDASPSFSLRGGTREILRGIIARGLGLR